MRAGDNVCLVHYWCTCLHRAQCLVHCRCSVITRFAQFPRDVAYSLWSSPTGTLRRCLQNKHLLVFLRSSGSVISIFLGVLFLWVSSFWEITIPAVWVSPCFICRQVFRIVPTNKGPRDLKGSFGNSSAHRSISEVWALQCPQGKKTSHLGSFWHLQS